MTDFNKITESDSNYTDLEKMSVEKCTYAINQEDQKVANAVQQVLPSINQLINAILPKMKLGGRLFYIGAGTSGRLGVLDASECPPTFGVDKNKVLGLIAGGDVALRDAVENAEDSTTQAWKDLSTYNIGENDCLIGIAASGTTPYVLGGINEARRNNITTGAITCNPQSPLAIAAQYPVEVVVGPEFLTGSSRMKAGTAQKMILNKISTTLMIQLGKVKGNKMVDMQLNNEKLFQRGVKMIQKEKNISNEEAANLLRTHKSVRNVLGHG
ncbi:N-acetylmuramic acid 6-phosphate etherase [Psychroflexus maritimus]|uniref:N-acetylmuramic acid 6-phosphate etherase n=1 Tax=Psychroflexus maritimus TaxID=2714865 RepID=A0A967DZ93_9FLAO|nr:N-acetylmuramic acid 6-phosphate etherase [Psychroflexus maritimus]NGZ90680.1 N-acetylmuramic acid 6-phosphate etherase [Psychroflexus maritimus]